MAQNNQGYGMQPPQQTMGREPQVHPQHQQQMTTVVVNQPGVMTNPLLVGHVHGTREWTSGLCDCCSDVGNSFYVFCCYCCAISSIAARLGENCCTTCCVPAAEIGIRTRIRTLGAIRGDMCHDCIIIACCTYCAACQELRELNAMGL
ncbi:cornifelin homolog [Mytilus edulis]|uniref:cornifelin homolog n=1 Tax=Mytilus edulis TaxID=6550 RepID=UPI0039EEDF04